MKEIASKIPTWLIIILIMIFTFLIVDSLYISKRPLIIFGKEFGFKYDQKTDSVSENVKNANKNTTEEDEILYFNKIPSFWNGHKDKMSILHQKNSYLTDFGLGLISKESLSLKEGSEIEIFIRANSKYGKSSDGKVWIQFMDIGLLAYGNSENSLTFKDLRSESDGVVFSLAPTYVKNKIYNGDRVGHEVLTNYKGYKSNVYDVYHEPESWNKITVSIFKENIKIYINNNLAVDYFGQFPENSFIGIADHNSSMGYSIKNKILFNYNTKLIKVKD